jgi:hypothetical protein
MSAMYAASGTWDTKERRIDMHWITQVLLVVVLVYIEHHLADLVKILVEIYNKLQK